MRFVLFDVFGVDCVICFLFFSLQVSLHILGFKVLRLAARDAGIELSLFRLWVKKLFQEEGHDFVLF